MKNPILIILFLLAALVITGCSSNTDNTNVVENITETEDYENPFEIEYTDITSDFLSGKYLGKGSDGLDLAHENIFTQDEQMVGVDYVSLCGASGNFICYLHEGKISSCTFGSIAFEDVTAFQEAILMANDKLAENLGADKKDLSFIGAESGEDMDEYEKVFAGAGTFHVNYEQGGISVTLIGMGVNSAATIVVELSSTVSE